VHSNDNLAIEKYRGMFGVYPICALPKRLVGPSVEPSVVSVGEKLRQRPAETITGRAIAEASIGAVVAHRRG